MPTVIGTPAAYSVAAQDTEYDLYAGAVDNNCVLVVNTKNMVNGDVVELRIYTKVLTGDALPLTDINLAYYGVFAHVQAQKVKLSVPVPAKYYIRCTIKQTGVGGTALPRSYDWCLLSVT
jgi:hypothetical protein